MNRWYKSLMLGFIYKTKANEGKEKAFKLQVSNALNLYPLI